MAPPKPGPLAESWDEDNTDHPVTAGARSPSRLSTRPDTSEGPGATSSTPASPQAGRNANESPQLDALLHPSQRSQQPRRSEAGSSGDKRPEKTTATASRLIAAGLGVKAPKRTEEQRQYDRALRDQERKARDDKRQAERRVAQEREQAQQAMWDD